MWCLVRAPPPIENPGYAYELHHCLLTSKLRRVLFFRNFAFYGIGSGFRHTVRVYQKTESFSTVEYFRDAER